MLLPDLYFRSCCMALYGEFLTAGFFGPTIEAGSFVAYRGES